MHGRSNEAIGAGTKANFAEVVALWKESVTATHDFLRKEDLAEIEKRMMDQYLPEAGELWLYRSGNDLAGFCANDGPFVDMLFVRPKFMRRGIGRSLLEHVKKLYGPLKLDVNEDNQNALAFYLQLGFKIAGRSPVDGQGRPYPLLRLEMQTGCDRQEPA